MKRGQIYYIKSTYTEEGSEQRGDRPAVIVSNDKNNEHSQTVEVVYMTTRPKTDLPTHVTTRNALCTSTILCEQVHTVSKSRVDVLIGTLSANEMQAVDSALLISLGLDFGKTPIMREPTEEELAKMLEELQRQKPQPLVDPQPDQSAELIKVQTERDIYRDLYRELLDHMKGATLS